MMGGVAMKTVVRKKRPAPSHRRPVQGKAHHGKKRNITEVVRPTSSSSGTAGVQISNILVPIDFSIHSKHALKYAVPLAEQFGASIHLVFVVEPTIYPADLGFGQVVLPGVEEELREKSAVELQSLINQEIGGRVNATSSVRSGNPHQEILDEAELVTAGDQEVAAELLHVDLIVVASHGHSGVEQILFGSTADRILHNARCPVLTVRPAEESGKKSDS